MAKEFITGLVLEADVVDYTTFVNGKGQPEKVSSQRIQLDLPEPSEEEAVEASTIGEHIAEQCGEIKGKVTASLSSDKVLMKIVSLPLVDDEELEGMVELQVDKFSPFPVEDLVVSHEVMAKTDEECIVLIAAVKTEVVASLGEILSSAGIASPRIDVSLLGWWRLIKDMGKIPVEGRHVLVLLHEATPEIVVVHDGIPIAFRSLAGTAGMVGADLIEDIASEMNYTLVSLDLEHGPAALESVSVWHADDQPKELMQRLSSDCGCSVAAMQADSLPSLSEGLARRGAEEAKLDLSPLIWREAETTRVFKSNMAKVAAVVFGVWAFAVILFVGGLYFQQMRVSALKSDLQDWQVPGREIRNMRRRIMVIEKYMDRRYSALECLREISEVQPQGIDLSLFSYRQSESLKLSGDAQARGQVLDFNNRLDKSKLFEKVIPGQIKQSKGKYRFDFELEFPGGDE
jgi:hypothetical protein